MKSHTDIEQSKKLAEILSVESVDMKWMYWKSEIDTPKIPTFGYGKFAAECYNNNTEGVYLPCWSLAALLNVINDDYYTTLYHDGVAWNITAIHHDNIKDKHNVYANTQVDACVEMILTLKEKDLL